MTHGQWHKIDFLFFFMCCFVDLRIHCAQTVSSFSHFLLFGTLMQDEFSSFTALWTCSYIQPVSYFAYVWHCYMSVTYIFSPWLATSWTCAFIHVQLVSYISLLCIFYLICKMLKTLFLFLSCYFVNLCIYILSW